MADFDRRETTDDKGILLRAVQKGLQSTIWTAVPGIIVSYDPAKMTCSVQVAIKIQVLDRFGNTSWVAISPLVDCPVVFPSGGGFTLTFPLTAGDECLVVLASRCIDSWWQSGGVQVQAELRMHDLSDGFVLPGPFSQPRVLTGVSATSVQLRSNDGTAYVQIQPSGEIDLQSDAKVTVNAPEADVTAPIINLTGNVNITGTLTVSGEIIGADLATPLLPSYSVHQHSGVTNGPHITGLPVPGT